MAGLRISLSNLANPITHRGVPEHHRLLGRVSEASMHVRRLRDALVAGRHTRQINGASFARMHRSMEKGLWGTAEARPALLPDQTTSPLSSSPTLLHLSPAPAQDTNIGTALGTAPR